MSLGSMGSIKNSEHLSLFSFILYWVETSLSSEITSLVANKFISETISDVARVFRSFITSVTATVFKSETNNTFPSIVIDSQGFTESVIQSDIP